LSRIKNRLIAALLATAAVPLGAVGLYSIHAHTQALRQLALAAAGERAQLKARKVEEMLREVRSDLFFLARSPMLFSLLDELGQDPLQTDFWRAKLGQQFLAFAHNKPVYTSLRYLDESGREVVRAEHDGLRSWLVPEERLERRATRDYFRAAIVLPAGELFLGVADRADGEAQEPVVRYALRVIDRHDQGRGVLVADLFARLLVEAARQEESSSTWLLDGEGRALSPLPQTPALLSAQAIRERLLGGERVVVETGEGTISWAPVWPVLPGQPPLWLLVDQAAESEVFASVRRFWLVFAGLVAAAMGAALLLSLLLARRIGGPLAQLRDGARRMGSGDLAYRLRANTGDEIQEVAEEFNRMGQALLETYDRLAEREAAKSEQLHKVTQQLVESEKLAAVGQLAAGVAHEINNPLGVLSMFVQQLLERGGLSQAQAEKLRLIERHAERVGRVTQGLLDFARVRQYRREPFDAGLVARAALESLGPRLEAAQTKVEFCAPEEGTWVVGDEEQVQQVFENLLLNAVQAMGQGGQLEVEVIRQGEEIVVQVADTGPGIPEEYRERIFEPFFTTKEVGQGTGLGLAIGYGIVKVHGGRMSAQNRPGGGALFTVWLPAAPDQTIGENRP
jgi:signal transduction histidine kinase